MAWRALCRRADLWIRQELIGPCVRGLRPLIAVAAYCWRRLLRRTTFIAITGSLGKTTAKELLGRILQEHGRVYKTIANQNGPLLVALNVLRVRPWHRYAVIEVAGAAHGMMRRSAPVIGPDVAVFLAMRRTHTTAFDNLEEHAREKAHLLRAMRRGAVVGLYADDKLVSRIADGSPFKVIRFGSSPEVELRADNLSARWPERLSFDLHCDGETHRVSTRLVGEHWLPSVLGALAAARAVGVPLDSAVRAVAAVEPFRGRLQPVPLPNGAMFLRDDYNASIDGANASFEVMRQAKARRRMLVVSDISDFHGNRKRRLRYMGALAPQIADIAVFIGESADYGARRAIEAGMHPERAFAFSALPETAQFLATQLNDGDLVLLKGRTTDHVARLYFSQVGPVSCWKDYCPKTMLCDECWEL